MSPLQEAQAAQREAAQRLIESLRIGAEVERLVASLRAVMRERSRSGSAAASPASR